MPKRDMLINYVPGEECRIAIVEDGRLEELYQERASEASHVNNIYKGRVVNVEPGIQAAFIDFGLERNGFLHITDLHPKYFRGDAREDTERVGHKTPRRERPLIQKCLKRGQEILVQVLKEGIGTKGPTLTSYLSIPGRFLVMMPDMERLGVSRKMEDDEARRAARDLLKELDPPKEFGFIIRTAGIGRTKTELKRDLAYLARLWKSIESRRKSLHGPGELYTESDLLIRTLRDVYATDIDRVIVDDESAAVRAADFLTIASPRAGAGSVSLYRDSIPMFHRFGIERQIESIHQRVVPLPSGGSLVIDSTEALVAIDVNSGKMRDKHDAETTAFKTNTEATDEICRQLRLRDLGGVVVCDLIDMRHLRQRREIEQRFRENLKRDRARTRILAISQFGILEMTRQRMRPSLTKSVYATCERCRGDGVVKSPESVVLDVMRRLVLVALNRDVARVRLKVSADIAEVLLNRRRTQLVDLQQRFDKPIEVHVEVSAHHDQIELIGFDARGAPVDAETRIPTAPPQLEPVEAGAFDEPYIEDEAESAAESVSEARASQQDEESADTTTVEADESDESDVEEADATIAAATGATGEEASDDGAPRKKRRRRGSRGGRGRRRKKAAAEAVAAHTGANATHSVSDLASDHEDDVSASTDDDVDVIAVIDDASEEEDASDAVEASTPEPDETAPSPLKKKRSRRSRRKPKSGDGSSGASGKSDTPAPRDSAPDGPRKKRSRRSRKKATPSSSAGGGSAPQASRGYSNPLLGDGGDRAG